MLEMVRSVKQAKFGDSGFQMEALRVTCNMTVADCAGASI